MKLAIKTCTLDMPYIDMLDFCVEQKVQAIEIGTGCWSNAPHIDLKTILNDSTSLNHWYDAIISRGLELCALNCSGNPLAYQNDYDIMQMTFELAQKLHIDKIVMMSGLPSACPTDQTPVWITTSWPPETQTILDYQWNEVAIPKWKSFVKMAKDCGIKQIALENHGMQLVYNPETLFRLRDQVDPMIGMNLDPSHLFWMGGDPIEAARVLGAANALFHVHAKDVRMERRLIGSNGFLDTQPIENAKNRTWNYVAVGAGHDLQWWKEFISVIAMMGYQDAISLEMEDLTMPMLQGYISSLYTLRQALVIA